MTRRRRTPGAVLLGLLVGSVSVLSAQDARVSAYLDRTQVGLNEQFVLSVELTGGSTLTQDPELPDVSEFARFLGTSSSQQIQIVNGRTTVSTTLQYRYLATREGSFEIPGVRVVLGGRTFVTDPVSLQIRQGGGGPAAPPGTPPQPRSEGDASSGIATDDLFLQATASKRRVYENEPVVVEYKIYTTVPVTSYGLAKQPGTAGFWVEDFELPASPQTHAEVIEGRRYTVATLKKSALFPTGPGRKTIEPMAIETEVRVRRRSGDPFEDFFGRSSLFGRSVSKVIASQPIAIDVVPLPSSGRPVNFSGFVGSLSVAASTDQTSVETNTAVTYRLQISGVGNLRSLPEPNIEFPPDFEVYPPETSERIEREGNQVSGRKTYSFVIIPRAPGVKTVPAVTYEYFDPRTGAYTSATTPPLDLEVTGDAVLAPVTTAGGRGAIRTLRNDIRFIRTEPAVFTPVSRTAFQQLGFWIAFLAPLAAVGGALGYRRHRDRLAGDVAYARHRRASRVAKRRLAKARSLARTETHEAFYRETNTALVGFLADRLNLSEAGLVRDDALEQLRGRDVPAGAVTSYFECLDRCDRNLFSPTSGDVGEMKACIEQAEQVMSALDRELSRGR